MKLQSISLDKLFDFMSKFNYVAIEWSNNELTAFIPNKYCDVQGAPGLEPNGASEYLKDSLTRNAFLDLEKQLANYPDFFIKNTSNRLPTRSELLCPKEQSFLN